jgi:WD40 repeat protein
MGGGVAQIWDTSTGLLIATCHGHIGGVNTVCIDPCKMSYIVSGGRGKLIKVLLRSKVANREIRVWHFVIEQGY